MNLVLRQFSPRRALAALSFVVVLTLTAHAGPPLICFPYSIGDAKCLPGGRDVFGTAKSYERKNLLADTLALLSRDTPIIIRMETLRRAALYATGAADGNPFKRRSSADERALASLLLQKLRERTQDATPADRALALFDVGFYAETLKQINFDPALDGYALLLNAAELRPGDADLEFALALASAEPKRGQHAAHLAQAKAGARSGTLLAANLASHFSR